MNEPCDHIIHTSLSCVFVLWPLGLWKRAQNSCGNCMVASIYLIIPTAQASFLFETNWFLMISAIFLSNPFISGRNYGQFYLAQGFVRLDLLLWNNTSMNRVGSHIDAKPKFHQTKFHMSHETIPFHYTGCLIGILIMVCYNPHRTG